MQRREFENYSERRTRRVLDLALAGSGHWVNAKTRLEDAIEVDSTDPTDERLFVRRAHFDYTIHRESTNVLLWAIEFDGPQHTIDVQQRRDIMKNRICAKAGLPLLRIDDRFLARRISTRYWLG